MPDEYIVARIPKLHSLRIHDVLDLGCGAGRHSILLASEGFGVHGIDRSANGISNSTEWAEREGLNAHFEIGEMDDLPFDDNSFDLVLAWNVIHHGTSDLVIDTVMEVDRVLRDGGFLFCTLISTEHIQYGIGTEVEPMTFTDPDREEGYPHHYFTRDAVNQLLTGFDILECVHRDQYENHLHWHVLARRA